MDQERLRLSHMKNGILFVSMIVMNNGSNDEWNLVFKVVSGADSSFYDLYMGEDTSTETKEDALNLVFSENRTKEHFKSDIINYWDSVNITQVKVSVYKDNTEEAYFLFDGTKSNKTNWFSKDRLLNTSYKDLMNVNDSRYGYYFSIDGHELMWNGNIIDRRFFINAFYKNCPLDAGWLLVGDIQNMQICDYEQQTPKGKVNVLFSPLIHKSIFHNDIGNNLADSMAIYVKFGTNEFGPTITDTTQWTTTEESTTKRQLSKQQLQDKMDLVKTQLTVDRRQTNKYKRTLISIHDKRRSSQTMGVVGSVIIAAVVGFIISLDCVTCCAKYKMKVKPNE